VIAVTADAAATAAAIIAVEVVDAEEIPADKPKKVRIIDPAEQTKTEILV
jgi:hypothetical protein